MSTNGSGGDRHQVRVSEESLEHIKTVAVDKDLSLGDAADLLIGTGMSRMKALQKYGTKQRKKRGGKRRKASSPSQHRMAARRARRG